MDWIEIIYNTIIYRLLYSFMMIHIVLLLQILLCIAKPKKNQEQEPKNNNLTNDGVQCKEKEPESNVTSEVNDKKQNNNKQDEIKQDVSSASNKPPDIQNNNDNNINDKNNNNVGGKKEESSDEKDKKKSVGPKKIEPKTDAERKQHEEIRKGKQVDPERDDTLIGMECDWGVGEVKYKGERRRKRKTRK